MRNKSVYRENLSDWPYRTGLRTEENCLIVEFLRKQDRVLDAGTAGGRILHELKWLGFSDLYGFDYVPEYIEIARKRDSSGDIKFSVADATDLTSYYESNFFDTVIYLQQIISNIPSEKEREKAVGHAYRVLKSGGYALFSFLSYDARYNSSIFYKLIMLWLRLLRIGSKGSADIQDQPWLKKPGGRFNWRFFLDQQPYNHWFRKKEAMDLLVRAGFVPLYWGFGSDFSNNLLPTDTFYDDYSQHIGTGMLYFVCRKSS